MSSGVLEQLERIDKRLYRIASYVLLPLFSLFAVIWIVTFLTNAVPYLHDTILACFISLGGFALGLSTYGMQVSKLLPKKQKILEA